MRQLQLFTRAELAAMRDPTASRNYSPERDKFRREHQRHRTWGLARRHAEKLRRARDGGRERWAASTDDDGRQTPAAARATAPARTPTQASAAAAALTPGRASAATSVSAATQAPGRTPTPSPSRSLRSDADSCHSPAPSGGRAPCPGPALGLGPPPCPALPLPRTRPLPGPLPAAPARARASQKCCLQTRARGPPASETEHMPLTHRRKRYFQEPR